MKLRFSNYKTSGVYSIQNFEIAKDSPLYRMIYRVLVAGLVLEGGPVFPNKSGGYRHPSEMANLLTESVSESFPGKRLTPTLMRSIYATKVLSDPKLSHSEIEKIALQMGTSTNMLLETYKKVDKM